MKRLQTFVSILTAGGLAASFLLADMWKALAVRHHLDFLFQLGGQFFIVGITTYLVREAASSAATAWTWLRRIVLGKQYIEGVWVDVVRAQGQEAWYGLCWIEPSGLSIRYYGCNHNQHGAPIGTFIADLLTFDWPRLSFKYHNSDDSTVETEGFGEFIFEPGYKERTVCYKGFVIDRNGNTSSVFGRKVVEPSLCQAFSDIRSRREALLTVIAELEAATTPTALRAPNPVGRADS